MHGEDRDRAEGRETTSESSFLTESAGTARASPSWSLIRRGVLGIGAACVVAAAAIGFLMLRPTPRNGNAQDLTEQKPPSPYFQNWGTPDLAIVLSGQMIGYDQPCGCSSPQYGGLARRYELMKWLKAKGWLVAAVDLGDIAMEKPNPQTLLKYETAMKALKLLDYSAIGLGRNEIKLPLIDAISHFALQKDNPKPRLLAANLDYAKDDEVLGQVKPFEIIEQGKMKVGVIGLVGSKVAESVAKVPEARFKDTAESLGKTLVEVGKQKVDLVVVLYQGLLEPDPELSLARECAEYCRRLHEANPSTIPKVDVLLCLTRVSEPPHRPEMVGPTHIVTLGTKSRFIGVVGVYKQPFELKYDLIPMGPEFETPAGKDDTNPVLQLLEDYAKEVQRRNLIAKFPRSWHPIQAPVQFQNAKYVGSERCGDCHEHAYKVWKDSAHSHAYGALEKAKRPSFRQFDGECVVCHAVGFQHPTGYLDANNTEKQNKKLLHVGCESCHGPGSLHADQPFQFPTLKKEMNPWKATAEELDPQTPKERRDLLVVNRLNHLDRFCIRCHDDDNDVHWAKVPFMEKWQKVAHPTPAAEAEALGIKKTVQK